LTGVKSGHDRFTLRTVRHLAQTDQGRGLLDNAVPTAITSAAPDAGEAAATVAVRSSDRQGPARKKPRGRRSASALSTMSQNMKQSTHDGPLGRFPSKLVASTSRGVVKGARLPRRHASDHYRDVAARNKRVFKGSLFLITARALVFFGFPVLRGT
jgi:hypothetical protein